jgi:hypothetical protein
LGFLAEIANLLPKSVLLMRQPTLSFEGFVARANQGKLKDGIVTTAFTTGLTRTGKRRE